MRLALLALAIAAAALPAAGGAQETTIIVQGRAAGLIGERFDGYVGMSPAAPDSIRRQVAAINIKRRALYSNLAARRGVQPQEVGIAAACTLLGRVAVGEAYLLPDGRWRRRQAGEGPPRPNYCG
jgi:uncharacterized protein YdbL (DUF1318 family)